MRITTKMIKMDSITSLQENMRRLSEIQEKLSAGKNIVRPSDDPVLTARSMDLTRSLNDIEQYQKNVEDNVSWLDYTDTALNNLTSVLQRARELTVKGANGTMPEDSLKAISSEVEQLMDHVISIGNTTYGGRYIFAGFKTIGDKPFEQGEAYKGDNGQMTREVSPGVSMSINVTGQEAFIDSGIFDGSNVGQGVFNDLMTALENGDQDAVGGPILEKIDGALDKILSLRAKMGARSHRMELTKGRWEEAKINTTQLLSGFQDVDVAEMVMKLKTEENVYQTALAAVARTIQPTLINFLN